jgi:hypothetical protein
MKHRLRENETLYVRSMGKALLVTHIATTDGDVNAICERDRDVGIVGQFGEFRLLARLHDKGVAIDDGRGRGGPRSGAVSALARARS